MHQPLLSSPRNGTAAFADETFSSLQRRRFPPSAASAAEILLVPADGESTDAAVHAAPPPPRGISPASTRRSPRAGQPPHLFASPTFIPKRDDFHADRWADTLRLFDEPQRPSTLNRGKREPVWQPLPIAVRRRLPPTAALGQLALAADDDVSPAAVGRYSVRLSPIRPRPQRRATESPHSVTDGPLLVATHLTPTVLRRLLGERPAAESPRSPLRATTISPFRHPTPTRTHRGSTPPTAHAANSGDFDAEGGDTIATTTARHRPGQSPHHRCAVCPVPGGRIMVGNDGQLWHVDGVVVPRGALPGEPSAGDAEEDEDAAGGEEEISLRRSAPLMGNDGVGVPTVTIATANMSTIEKASMVFAAALDLEAAGETENHEGDRRGTSSRTRGSSPHAARSPYGTAGSSPSPTRRIEEAHGPIATIRRSPSRQVSNGYGDGLDGGARTSGRATPPMELHRREPRPFLRADGIADEGDWLQGEDGVPSVSSPAPSAVALVSLPALTRALTPPRAGGRISSSPSPRQEPPPRGGRHQSADSPLTTSLQRTDVAADEEDAATAGPPTAASPLQEWPRASDLPHVAEIDAGAELSGADMADLRLLFARCGVPRSHSFPAADDGVDPSALAIDEATWLRFVHDHPTIVERVGRVSMSPTTAQRRLLEVFVVAGSRGARWSPSPRTVLVNASPGRPAADRFGAVASSPLVTRSSSYQTVVTGKAEEPTTTTPRGERGDSPVAVDSPRGRHQASPAAITAEDATEDSRREGAVTSQHPSLVPLLAEEEEALPPGEDATLVDGRLPGKNATAPVRGGKRVTLPPDASRHTAPPMSAAVRALQEVQQGRGDEEASMLGRRRNTGKRQEKRNALRRLLGDDDDEDDRMKALESRPVTCALEKNTHRVQRGESWSSIAELHGVTEDELREVNPNADVGRRRPEAGTVLAIPA